MKCPNCGADLEPNKNQTMKFCPYCGHKVEIVQEIPKTIAGALHGIAKGVIDEVGKQKEYEREHAEEIEERNRKRREEEHKKDVRILVGIGVVMLVLFGYIHMMAERERAEKKASPTGMLPTYTETIHLA